MILTGNVMINGSASYGLKLMEGIREYDLVMISASDMKGSLLSDLTGCMLPDATLLMKADISHPTMLENMMKMYGFYSEGTFEENSEKWISFRRVKRTKTLPDLNLQSYIRSTQSILNVNLFLEDTVRNIFNCNYHDCLNRTFVIIQEIVDENMFENIRKQAFIFETKFERIVLDDQSIKTVA